LITLTILGEEYKPCSSSLEMKFTPLEGELKKFFVECGRSDITPSVASKSSTFDMAVKWRVKFPRIGDHCSTGFSEEVP
jgi:hypothetical protein